jgi:hypothetical protein
MTRPLTMFMLVAAVALAGCDNSDQTIVSDPAGPDPMANAVANVGSVTLPPSIQASKAYRCKDNSLIYVDWYSDGSARVKKTRQEVGAPAIPAGDPSLTGDAKAASITYNGQSCKA